MIRFFYILGVLGKYAALYFLIKLNLYKNPRHKVLRNFFEEAGGTRHRNHSPSYGSLVLDELRRDHQAF